MKISKAESYVLDRLLLKNGKTFFLNLPGLPDKDAIDSLGQKGLVSHVPGQTKFTVWASLNHEIYNRRK